MFWINGWWEIRWLFGRLDFFPCITITFLSLFQSKKMSIICFKKLFVSVLNIWSSLTSPFFTFHPRTRENCSVFRVWYLKVSLCSRDDLKMAVVQRNKCDASQPWTYSRKGKSRVVVITLTGRPSVKTTPATNVSSILLWCFFSYW